jgi:hypothetical protein
MHHHGSINWIALAAALSIVTSEARAIMARSLEKISKARWETRPARPGRNAAQYGASPCSEAEQLPRVGTSITSNP